MIDNYERSRKIIKEASKLKNVDILKAITLIQESISICPERILSDHFKLATYLHLSGQLLEAYQTLDHLLSSFDKNDYGMFNMNRSLVFEHKSTLLFKDKLYRDYLYTFCDWLWNTTLALAFQGRAEDIKRNENINPLEFFAPTKIDACFMNLGKFEIKNKFNSTLINFFSIHRPQLLSLAIEVENISNDFSSLRNGESIGEKDNRLLGRRPEIIAHYNRYNFSDIFETFYNSELLLLLTY